ncbi:MAG: flavin reductase family protein [Pseudomonadota bacterium]
MGETVSTQFSPGADPRAFRSALGQFGTGVCVITTQTELGQDVGITANSFASVSLDPALVLWSPAKAARRFEVYSEAKHTAIHILASDQASVAMGFVKEANAFGSLDVTRNAHGTPLIGGALAVFECTRRAAHDAGDHVILVDQVDVFHLSQGAPLLFTQGSYGGFTPHG